MCCCFRISKHRAFRRNSRCCSCCAPSSASRWAGSGGLVPHSPCRSQGGGIWFPPRPRSVKPVGFRGSGISYRVTLAERITRSDVGVPPFLLCPQGEADETERLQAKERQMSQTVADVLVGVLEEIGVKHIFGLIGDSLNPLADAVRRSKIEWIGVRHEEGAALAAAGQAKLTGRLAVCAGTTGPGSTHLVAGLYEASRDHAPVLALSGDMPRKLHGTDFIQSTAPDLLFRDVSLYTETISSAAQAPGVIHQAIAAAYAGPGVAHLTLPQDVISAKAEGHVASVATLKPRPEIAASEADTKSRAESIRPTAS